MCFDIIVSAKGTEKSWPKRLGWGKLLEKEQQNEPDPEGNRHSEEFQNKGTASKSGGAELSVQSGEWAKKDHLEAQQMRRAQLSANGNTNKKATH